MSSPFDEPPDEPGRLIPGSAKRAIAEEEGEKSKQQQTAEKAKEEQPTPAPSPQSALHDALEGGPVPTGSAERPKQQEPKQPPKQQEGPNRPADDAWRTLLRRSQQRQGGSGAGGTPAASPARPAGKASPSSAAAAESPRRRSATGEAAAKVGTGAKTPPRASTGSGGGSALTTPTRPSSSPASPRPARRASATDGSVGSAGSGSYGTPVGTPASEAQRAQREQRRGGGTGTGTGTGTAAGGTSSTDAATNQAAATANTGAAARTVPAAAGASPGVSPAPSPRRIAGVGGAAIADPDASLLKRRLEAEAEARAKSRSRSRGRSRGRGGDSADVAGGVGGSASGSGSGGGTDSIPATPVGTPSRASARGARGGGIGAGSDELDELVKRSDERRSKSAASGGGGGGGGGGASGTPRSASSRKGTAAGSVPDFSPSPSSSSGEAPTSAQAQRRMADEMAELDALVREAESPDRLPLSHNKGKGGGGGGGGGGGARSEAAYDTRSIHDVPPSPPTPASSVQATKGGADGREGKVQEDVGTLAQMLEEVDMDDIRADPGIDLLPHADEDEDDDDEEEEVEVAAEAAEDSGGDTWQPFAAGAFPSSGAAAAASATSAAAASGTVEPRGVDLEEAGGDAVRRRTQVDPPEQGDDVMSVAMFSVDGGDQTNLFHSDPFAGSGVVPSDADPMTSNAAAFAAFDAAGGKASGEDEVRPSLEPSDDQKKEPYREDDAELGANLLSTSTSNDNDVDAEAGGESQADRIQRYNQRSDGNSSSDEDDDSSVEDSDGEEEEEEEAQFQAMDDYDDDDEDDDNTGGHRGVRFEPSVSSAEHHPLPSRTFSADDDGASSIVASSVPPPPPPRRAADQLVSNLLAGKRSGASNNDGSADAKSPEVTKKSIPLIKPPPAEKMKAWASSKGLISTDNVQSAPSNDNPINLTAVQAAERAIAEAKRQLGEPVEEKPKEDSNDQSQPISLAEVDEQGAITNDDESFTNTNSDEPAEEVDAESVQNVEANEEQIRSHIPVTTKVPVEKETPEDRARLAAKFASASSAAAQVFEKNYERSPRGSPEGRSRIAHASVPSMDDGNTKDAAGTTDKSSSFGLFCGSDENYACGGEPDGSPKSTELRPPGAFEIADLDPKVPSHDEVQRGVDLHGGAFNSWVKDYDSPSKREKDDLSSIGMAEDEVKAAEHAAASAINRSGRPSADFVPAPTSALSPLLENPPTASLLSWVKDVAVGLNEKTTTEKDTRDDEAAKELQVLLASHMVFNKLCEVSVQSINYSCTKSDDKIVGYEIIDGGSQQAQVVVFINFLERVALATNSSVPSPFDKGASAIAMPPDDIIEKKTLQDLIFHDEGTERVVRIVSFLYDACRISAEKKLRQPSPETPRKSSSSNHDADATPGETVKRRNARGGPAKSAIKPSTLAPTTLFGGKQNKNLIVPKRYPSPFETSVWNSPSIVPKFLSFLGDPAAVCRMKAVNRDCHRIISDNEHVIMKTAVRLGGLEMHLRPSFWMWITLEKCRPEPNPNAANDVVDADGANVDLEALSKAGEEGRWHHTLMRDVTRSFGNMPPHKSGQKLRKDSIVRALVFYGQGRLIKRGVKGGVDNYQRDIANIRQGPASKSGPVNDVGEDDSITSDQSPTDTVSDWGAVSPVGSTVSISNSKVDADVSLLNDSKMSASGAAGAGTDPDPINQNPSMQSSVASVEVEDIALCPRDLTNEVKEDLQNKLGFILHALAASNDKVGYCQGMDYIVAHLLRILQETVLYRAVKGTLPPVIKSKLRKSRSSSPSPSQVSSPRPPSPARSTASAQGIVSALDIDESSLVVEEAVYRVMHTMLTTYGLQHFYWPELRCLKTCCKVFERLIEIKLPVLADHFDHHGLNVGIFALGWFQTLFLYLPSMPTATVCHMWDIWLVERSFKIFFRVGTAILFLSQPILLNHELEGMMTYLNTMPDATLLNPDILLACANQIKVTNRMLEEIERTVTGQMAASASAKVDIAEKEAERQSTCSPFR